MTQKEYMEQLREKLGAFNKGLQDEILEDYEQHFAEGLAEGRSEEEIISELGKIEDMIQEFTEEDYRQELIPETVTLKQEQPEATDNLTGSGQYREIVLDNQMADAVLVPSEDGQLHVEYQADNESFSERYAFYQEERDGIFYVGIREKKGAAVKGSRRFSVFGKTYTMFSYAGVQRDGGAQFTLQIPKDFPRVTVQSKSGDVELEGLCVRALCLKSGSGDLKLGKLDLENLQLQTASGDVRLERVYAKKIEAETASGDLSADSIRGEDGFFRTASGDMVLKGEMESCQTRTGSGDAVVKLSGQVKNVRMDTGSGDVSLELRAEGGAEVRASAGSGEVQISGNGILNRMGKSQSCVFGEGMCKVAVSSGSGDISILCTGHSSM
jgi:hypothetical protein